MVLQNDLDFNQEPIPNQEISNSTTDSGNPNLQPTEKPIFLYLIGFFIFCIILFIFWASYRIYQIRKKSTTSNIKTETIDDSNKTNNFKMEGGMHACAPQNGGKCLIYPLTVINEICPITFNTNNCDNKCGDPTNHCKE